MGTNYLPLWKTFETPLTSLDESYVEMFSLLVLFIFTLVAMVVRWRRQFIRHVVQVLSLVVFFYIIYSCLGVFGMVRNLLYGFTLIGTVPTESFFWMSLPLVVIAFTLTTGPYFCGWICPTGAFQEATAAMRENLHKLFSSSQRRLLNWSLGIVFLVGSIAVIIFIYWFGTNEKLSFFYQVAFWGLLLLLDVFWWVFVRRAASKVHLSAPHGPRGANLLWIGTFFLIFLAAVLWLGSTKRFYVEDSSLFWGACLILLTFLVVGRWLDDAGIRALRGISLAIIIGSALLKTVIVSPIHFAFADVRDPASALTTLVLVVASVFVSRAWCRYVCPWGFLMGKLHRVSRLRVMPSKACTECGTCSSVCRVDAIRNGKVSTADCQFCLSCVDHCPRNALEVLDVWKKAN